VHNRKRRAALIPGAGVIHPPRAPNSRGFSVIGQKTKNNSHRKVEGPKTVASEKMSIRDTPWQGRGRRGGKKRMARRSDGKRCGPRQIEGKRGDGGENVKGGKSGWEIRGRRRVN